ncbi:hypothetical protein Cci01nite_18050 [Catellatospora citrea]|uniref:Uncharacterized protein n=1 Tax=Catellatospora citrea TaxID=53366 RepID=A0A8J3K4S3_9ACTN|nr:hypothetical protein Cci01nite_18050 [Catellatospora citrea]
MQAQDRQHGFAAQARHLRGHARCRDVNGPEKSHLHVRTSSVMLGRVASGQLRTLCREAALRGRTDSDPS